MVLFKKVLAFSVLTGAGIVGYKYLTHKSEPFKPVKVITDNKYFKGKLQKQTPEQVSAFQSFFENDSKDPKKQKQSFVDF